MTEEEKEIYYSISHGSLGFIKESIDELNSNMLIYGDPLLVNAIYNNQFEIIQYLIAVDADINLAGKNSTPLITAIDLEYEDIATFLINKGADVNKKDNKNNSPLSKAIFKYNDGESKLIELLLEKGANPRQELSANYSCLELVKSLNLTKLNMLFKNFLH
jgi:ankyrin repeat protein